VHVFRTAKRFRNKPIYPPLQRFRRRPPTDKCGGNPDTKRTCDGYSPCFLLRKGRGPDFLDFSSRGISTRSEVGRFLARTFQPWTQFLFFGHPVIASNAVGRPVNHQPFFLEASLRSSTVTNGRPFRRAGERPVGEARISPCFLDERNLGESLGRTF